jgi:hypothetical protein
MSLLKRVQLTNMELVHALNLSEKEKGCKMTVPSIAGVTGFRGSD